MTIKKTFVTLAIMLVLIAGCKPKSIDTAEEPELVPAVSFDTSENDETLPEALPDDETGILPAEVDFATLETDTEAGFPQTFEESEVPDEPEIAMPTAEETPAVFAPDTYHPPASSSVFEDAANAGAAARGGSSAGHFTAPAFSNPAITGSAHASGSGVTDDTGYITLIEDIEVPAQEAGVLTELKVKEGDTVKLGDALARIDDEQAQMAVTVGESKLAAAERKASNDVNIKYANAAKDVAYAEILQADEANAKVRNTVTDAEYRRLLLAHKQAVLQIEQATHDFVVSKYEVDVQRTELKAAQLGVTRRVIKAPSPGIILERFRHQGEWVKPGDPLVRLARLDVVRLKFQLDARNVPMSGVRGRNVEVKAPLLPGKAFHGKITFVDPVLIAGTKYQVWVEIQNEQENGEWLLRPAMRANAELK